MVGVVSEIFNRVIVVGFLLNHIYIASLCLKSALNISWATITNLGSRPFMQVNGTIPAPKHECLAAGLGLNPLKTTDRAIESTVDFLYSLPRKQIPDDYQAIIGWRHGMSGWKSSFGIYSQPLSRILPFWLMARVLTPSRRPFKVYKSLKSWSAS